MDTCCKCGGHGMIKCPVCEGQGKVHRVSLADTGLMVCTKCKGLGDINCQNCQGYGNI